MWCKRLSSSKNKHVSLSACTAYCHPSMGLLSPGRSFGHCFTCIPRQYGSRANWTLKRKSNKVRHLCAVVCIPSFVDSVNIYVLRARIPFLSLLSLSFLLHSSLSREMRCFLSSLFPRPFFVSLQNKMDLGQKMGGATNRANKLFHFERNLLRALGGQRRSNLVQSLLTWFLFLVVRGWMDREL